MKKNNIILILIIGLSLIFAGCSSNSGSKQNGILSIGGGSSSNLGSGVTLEFAENNPPSKMIKATPYTFAFVFKNSQREDITDLRLRTRGFERGYVIGLNKDYSISKIPKATTQGGVGIYPGFIVSNVVVDQFTNTYPFNPIFEYCYTAKSYHREELCVPAKDNNQCLDKIQPNSEANGPISVSVDRINSIGTSIRMDFTINNFGNGKVVNTCFDTKEYSNDYILNSVKLGTSIGTCKANSGYKIIGGKSSFYCTFPRTSDESYGSSVLVDITTKYDQEIQKQILVEDLNFN